MSNAIVEEDVIGPEQNSFRPGRGCGNNLFIFNTLVERHEQTKSLNFCFIDLKAAYDSVNRQILWRRLKKLNVPTSLITLLKDYYCDDNITCNIGNVISKRHNQTQGLRQGCYYSPTLFSLYMIDLSQRLEQTDIEGQD